MLSGIPSPSQRYAPGPSLSRKRARGNRRLPRRRRAVQARVWLARGAVAQLALAVLPRDAAQLGIEIERVLLELLERLDVARPQIDAVDAVAHIFERRLVVDRAVDQVVER